MSESLEATLLAVERGDEGAALRLRSALARAPLEQVHGLAAHKSEPVRAALAAALPGRTEVEAATLALALARDGSQHVRLQLARALAHESAWGPDELYGTLFDDLEWQVRHAIAAAACLRESLLDELGIALIEDPDEDVRALLAASLAGSHPERALPGLIENVAGEHPTSQRAAAVGLLAILKRFDGLPPVVALPSREVVRRALQNLRTLGKRRFAPVIAALERGGEDPTAIELPGGRGTNLTREARAGRLDRAAGVERHVAALLEVLQRPKSRAAVLIGESGVGKTAIVHELVRRLAEDPAGAWLVVRLVPSEFLIGTKYMGEWQTEVARLVEALGSSRRTLLYVPGLHDLARVGAWEKSDENVAAMLVPHIESGRIAVIGESTAPEFAAGFGRSPSLRRAWTTIDVEPATREQTLRVLRSICERAGLEAGDATLARLDEYAEMFLASTAQPGRSAGLLRRAAARIEGRLTLGDVLDELSRTTGVPVDLLDDESPLDLEQLRAFFEARVMGQPEAIDAIVDLVTLVKAGLTDPQKPLAVLFFVGPTGVGKTELARALAERVFGDPARLVRFDMSEFASYESYERLIGARSSGGLLTNAVREKPFSVVLLDEIEKAHKNVFDLCLQLFDAGRLTDGSGRTVDFRRSVLILTSNVGSAVASEARLGFSDAVPRAPEESEVLRALREYFRPEFLNRIDRVVVFRPLAIETAEKIARRELASVLRRGGIERRGLALDIDPGLLALLLRSGYSQAFGARPLKRTIERLVLLPVARAIASGAAPSGSVVQLAARAERVDVRILPPEPPADAEPPSKPSAGLERLRERSARLVEALEPLERDGEALAARRSELVTASNARGFWDQRADALRTLDELHRVESLLATSERLARRARATAEQTLRARDARFAAELEERTDELENEARLVGLLLASSDPADLADAWILLTHVRSKHDQLGGVEKLARMYLAWAKRRQLDAEVAGDRLGGSPSEDSIVLALRGAGAFRLLRAEGGLHVVRTQLAGQRARPAATTGREVVRVDVLRAVDGDGHGQPAPLPAEFHALRGQRGRLIPAPTLEVRVVDRVTATSVVLWSDRPRAEAEQTARELLAAQVAALACAAGGHDAIVRRYELAPHARARGAGISAKLHRVLEGDIDRFLV